MTDQITEFDVEQAKQELRQDYKQKTGEELPDHVVENIDVLSASGPNFHDMAEIVQRTKLSEKADRPNWQIAASMLVTAIVVGSIAYSLGLGLAANFGTAVIALVSAAFGFSVAVLFS